MARFGRDLSLSALVWNGKKEQWGEGNGNWVGAEGREVEREVYSEPKKFGNLALMTGQLNYTWGEGCDVLK